MSEDPVFIAQTAEPEHLAPDALRAWFKECSKEANAKGATFFRYSVDNENSPTRALVEGWEVAPDEQGNIRWQVKAT